MQLHDALDDQTWKRTDPTIADMAEQLQVLCRDLPEHIRLETEVLFPSVKSLIKEEGLAEPALW